MKTFSAIFFLAAITTVVAGEPVLVRVQNFTVNPSTGPATAVVVRNELDRPYTGTVRLQFPAGWKIAPAQHTVILQPHETKTLPFTIESAAETAANSYPVQIQIDNLTWTQQVVCASAPYFKPVIDGDLSEWQDAIPITFTGITVRTYWNKAQFCLALEVSQPAPSPAAVQFALAPAAGNPRYRFTITADRHCILEKLEPPYGKVVAKRPEPSWLPQLIGELPDAKIAINQTGNITAYEIAVPFKAMPELKPTAGREFCFGVLVRDAAGVRDLGTALNLWPDQRQMQPSLVEFGFCSSVH